MRSNYAAERSGTLKSAFDMKKENREEHGMRNQKGKSVVSLIMAIALCVILGGCSSKTRVKIPLGSNDYKDMAYNEVMEEFEKAGFINIASEEKESTIKANDGKVFSITVDDKTTFSQGKAMEEDVPVKISYYKLKTVNITMHIQERGDPGEPVFEVQTNLPDGAKVNLTLKGNGYQKKQVVKIKSGKATSDLFQTDDRKPLGSGDYTLTAEMNMKDQSWGVQGELGNDGECMTGDVVKENADGTASVLVESTYTSTYDENNLSVEAIQEVLRQSYKNSFGDNFSIETENNIMTMKLWGDGVATNAMFAAMGDKENLDTWNTLVESVTKASMQTQQDLNNNGHSDVAFVMEVVNDINKENVLLVVTNGIVMYDAANGIDLLG